MFLFELSTFAGTPTGAMAGKIQAPLELRAGKRWDGSGPKGAPRR